MTPPTVTPAVAYTNGEGKNIYAHTGLIETHSEALRKLMSLPTEGLKELEVDKNTFERFLNYIHSDDYVLQQDSTVQDSFVDRIIKHTRLYVFAVDYEVKDLQLLVSNKVLNLFIERDQAGQCPILLKDLTTKLSKGFKKFLSKQWLHIRLHAAHANGDIISAFYESLGNGRPSSGIITGRLELEHRSFVPRTETQRYNHPESPSFWNGREKIPRSPVNLLPPPKLEIESILDSDGPGHLVTHIPECQLATFIPQ